MTKDSPYIKDAEGLKSEIFQMINSYSHKDPQADTHEFIVKHFMDSGVFMSEDDAVQTASEICNTIDGIRAGYEGIQEYRTKGLSADIWLRDRLDSQLSNIATEERDSVIENISSALGQSNSEMFSIFSGAAGGDRNLSGISSYSFVGDNRTFIAKNLHKNIQQNSHFSNMLYEEALEGMDEDSVDKINVVAEYFDSPLGSKEDKDFKKIISTGVEISKRKDMLGEDLTEVSPTVVATLVDTGMTTTKTAYAVASNKMAVEDAADYLIDNSVSRLEYMATTFCAQTGGVVGAAVGGAIGKVFGPKGVGVGAKVGREVGRVAGAAVAKHVVQGMRKVGNIAKKTVSNIFQGVNKAKESVKRWIASLW